MEKFVISSVLPFLAGALFMGILFLVFEKKNLSKAINALKGKIQRFVKHTISLIVIFIALIIIYYVFKYFGYGDDILPNLISVAVSVLLIDFLLKERDIANREKVKIIVDKKLDAIMNRIQAIVLKFIKLDDAVDGIVTKDIIKGLIEKQDIVKDEIDYLVITEQGNVEDEKIPIVDFTYYIGKEMEKDLNDLISNFREDLTPNQICLLLNIKEIFSHNIFKVKCSKMYNKLEDKEYELIKENLLEVLFDLNNILEENRRNV